MVDLHPMMLIFYVILLNFLRISQDVNRPKVVGFTPYLVEMLKAMISIGENHFASYGARFSTYFYHFTHFGLLSEGIISS